MSTDTIIYRLETPLGRGPFVSGARWAYDQNHRCRDEWHRAGDGPGPFSETGQIKAVYNQSWSWPPHLYFGFRSKAQLKRWFRSKVGRRAMKAKGIQLSVYRIAKSNVIHGRAQIAFDRKHAQLTNVLCPETLQ